ncbi:aspartate/glutamate racemase family protein [Streptomyces sp. NBC_01023]|uniref:aspartate/glutamate racemase family protein n=1 Tax=Streptomyces sp. NBC_01023 TaxID=2903724 RepID=UPI00386E2227|nr:aspartate/glutamate racemase family protein [Streptomyces sp. NBC_01023]
MPQLLPYTGTRTVVLVNPNTNRGTTSMMAELARKHLTPAGLAVESLTAGHGPSMIVDPVTLKESARHVVDVVRSRLAEPCAAPVAAVIIAAIGDPAREQLAAELDIPVIGIGQASIVTAAAGGRRFGMATSTSCLVGSLTELVGRHGASDTFTGVRLTPSDPLVLAASAEQQYRELAAAVRACVEQDGAEAVIIAGGPLSRTARRLAALGLVEIVEPVPSAGTLVIDALRAAVREGSPG